MFADMELDYRESLSTSVSKQPKLNSHGEQTRVVAPASNEAVSKAPMSPTNFFISGLAVIVIIATIFYMATH
jgi:hypothetical protein